VHEYLERHPGRFAAPWMAHVDDPTSTNSLDVLVVEVIEGDVEQARADLTPLHDGNLCVVAAGPHAVPSGPPAEGTALMDRLGPLMQDRANGIYAAGADESGRVHVDLMVLDQHLYDQLAAIGIDRMDLTPLITPMPR
jgi:hypothetical protein